MSDPETPETNTPGRRLSTSELVRLWRDMRRGKLYSLDGEGPALHWDFLGLALLAEVERDPTDFIEALHQGYVKVGKTGRKVDLEEWQQCTYEMFLAIIKHSQEKRTEEQTLALLSLLEESSRDRFRLNTAFEDAFKLAKRDRKAPDPLRVSMGEKVSAKLKEALESGMKDAEALDMAMESLGPKTEDGSWNYQYMYAYLERYFPARAREFMNLTPMQIHTLITQNELIEKSHQPIAELPADWNQFQEFLKRNTEESATTQDRVLTRPPEFEKLLGLGFLDYENGKYFALTSLKEIGRSVADRSYMTLEIAKKFLRKKKPDVPFSGSALKKFVTWSKE